MSADGNAIVAAERAIPPDDAGPSCARVEETLPSVGVTCAGTPILAYLSRSDPEGLWELWVMPVAAAEAGGRPRVLAAARRKLAVGCTTALLAFSADGRWLYATRHAGVHFRVERYAVPEFADGRTVFFTRRRRSDRVGRTNLERLEDRQLLTAAEFELSSLLTANGGDGSSDQDLTLLATELLRTDTKRTRTSGRS